MTKVAIVGTVGIPACYGGFETLAENLVVKKKNHNIVYQVYCSGKHYKKRIREYHGAKLVYISLNANGWQTPLYDVLCMIHAYFSCDIILSLGTGGCLVKPFLNFFRRKKVVINYDGLDCSRKKWNWIIQKYIAFIDWFASQVSDAGIADNEAIRRNVEIKYGKQSELIEYGGDNAFAVQPDETFYDKYSVHPQKYILAVARIEPENNIDLILNAAVNIPQYDFVIVGNWGHSKYSIDLKEKFASFDNIHLLGPYYDPMELNVLRSNCSLYLHGHCVGGTNPSLVEAMHLALPIFAYDVIFNRETTENKAEYFNSSETLIKLINEFPKERIVHLKNEMKKIADKRYRWEIICEKYERLLEKIYGVSF